MKDRKRQRENRRHKEELIDRRNLYGVPDPTPYEAVRNIRNGHFYLQSQKKEAKTNG